MMITKKQPKMNALAMVYLILQNSNPLSALKRFNPFISDIEKVLR